MLKALPLIARWISRAHDHWCAATAVRRPLAVEVALPKERVARFEEENELLRARLSRLEGTAPEASKKPVLFRIVVSEATIEAIVPILEENPRGLLLVRDELSGWMKSFDAYRNGRGSDREHWLSVHRANAIIVDRKTDRETRFVEHGFIAVCGGTQPGILRRTDGRGCRVLEFKAQSVFVGSNSRV